MGSRRDAKYCLCKSTTKLAWFLHHVRQRFCSDELFMAMSSYPGLNCSRNHRIHWQGKSVSRWKAGNQVVKATGSNAWMSWRQVHEDKRGCYFLGFEFPSKVGYSQMDVLRNL
ncbi:hypothetical protein F2Q68_00031204 [Brassica cretica]|uniref:Uncharacterized protein n=1 Tax=Brassica cretica TaxID=69181 RepID=A0A8S9GH97_BRACR|nr:hypothetical protein F2Q68_00031204 [Brassica cretica]